MLELINKLLLFYRMQIYNEIIVCFLGVMLKKYI